MRTVAVLGLTFFFVFNFNGCSSSSSAQGPRQMTELESALEQVGTPLPLAESRVLFVAKENIVNSPFSVWVTDMTAEGTEQLFENARLFNDPVWNGRAFVHAIAASEDQLWMTDGTLAGTELLASFDPGPPDFEFQLALNGDTLFVFGYSSDHTVSPIQRLGSTFLAIELQ